MDGAGGGGEGGVEGGEEGVEGAGERRACGWEVRGDREVGEAVGEGGGWEGKTFAEVKGVAEWLVGWAGT